VPGKEPQVRSTPLRSALIPLLSESVRSVVVKIDNMLSVNTHINEMCKSVRYHTRGLRHVRKCVSTDDAKQIASALVSVRLDYCNLILYKTSKSNISKLQRLQNSLTRVVSGTRKRDHITPILVDLHRLSISSPSVRHNCLVCKSYKNHF